MTESQKAQRPAGTGRSGQTEQQAPANNRLVALWRLVGAATRTPDLSRGDVAVLWAILDRIGTDGTAWPGYGRIAKDTGLHRATVARSVVNLVQTGFLHRESGGPGKSNRYRLGVRAHATSSVDATSSTDATGVYAPTRLGVYAPTRPEPASLNLPKEPTQSTRAKTQPKDKAAKRAPDGAEFLTDVDPKIARDYLAIRQAKRLPLTETAADGLRSEARKAGVSLSRALEICCLRGWAGFQASWLDKESVADVPGGGRKQLGGYVPLPGEL